MIYRKIFILLFLTFLLIPAFAFAQPMEEEEEPAQARPNPYARTNPYTRTNSFAQGSQTMRFMTKAFGSLSSKSIKSLQVGKKVRLIAKKNVNARNAGFSVKSGQKVLVSLKRGGICLQRGHKGKATKGIILHNSKNNNSLIVKSRVNTSTFKGRMVINEAGLQFRAKPVKQINAGAARHVQGAAR